MPVSSRADVHSLTLSVLYYFLDPVRGPRDTGEMWCMRNGAAPVLEFFIPVNEDFVPFVFVVIYGNPFQYTFHSLNGIAGACLDALSGSHDNPSDDSSSIRSTISVRINNGQLLSRPK